MRPYLVIDGSEMRSIRTDIEDNRKCAWRGTSVLDRYSFHRGGLHAYEYLGEPSRLAGIVSQIIEGHKHDA